MTAVLILLPLGLLLLWLQRPQQQSISLAERIDALLPQTQCGRCGFNGCRPYAEAVAAQQAAHNRCPPGGDLTLRALSELLGESYLPLAEDCDADLLPRVAWIDEQLCIGCTKCIQACPVDAIIGAPKLMHTVITDRCTGCDLCLPPCPVDCIDLVPQPVNLRPHSP